MAEETSMLKTDSTRMFTPPRNILSLNTEEKKAFINSFDHVFCDCDGVIWDLQKTIEGSGEAINCLKNAGKRVLYVSNNNVRPKDNYMSQFEKAGIKSEWDDVIIPVQTIVDYLKEKNFKGLIYCIGTSEFKSVLKEAGFKVIDGPNKILEESFTDLARNVFDSEPVRAVVVDVDFNLSAAKLIRAQLYLNHPDCILVAGATDVLLPVKRDLGIIGPGAFLKILVDATGKQPILLGKPGVELGQMVLKRYNIKNPKRILVIGDMLDQDVVFGKVNGFQTMVVLTGGCKKEHLNCKLTNDQTPTYYAESIADLTTLFQSLND